ncbi:MAG: transglycosylase SLT domain-containing protein [Syntrophaceae bacterium]|nr:transglycosylase SLT domain-containing protein [Syntrophaceae bacterium]
MKISHQLFRTILIVAVIIFYTINGETQTGWQHSFGQSCGQALIKALKIKEHLTFCNELVPLNEWDVRERLERELLVCLNNSDNVILWLKRSNRYFPYIEKVLKNNSLPDDLKYIVITESHLKPRATSVKGAVGFWQFIKSTAFRYGMKVNKNIDERRNFFSSTEAAINYLKDLYNIFGSWTLAAAAYNMGENGLRTEMLMQKVNNYYKLYLNQETQRYVFKILAAKLILSNPERYGFYLTKDDLYKPIQFDVVEINVSKPVPIYIIAQAANTYFKVIKDLNPHLNNYYLSAGRYNILIPKGSARGFNERYENLLRNWRDDKEIMVYTVRKGDNLATISKHFNVSIKALMKWNGLTKNKKISSGDKLFIPNDTD